MTKSKKFDMEFWQACATGYCKDSEATIKVAQGLVAELSLPRLYGELLLSNYNLGDPKLACETWMRARDVAHGLIVNYVFDIERRRISVYQKSLTVSEHRDVSLKQFANKWPNRMTEERAHKIARDDALTNIRADLYGFQEAFGVANKSMIEGLAIGNTCVAANQILVALQICGSGKKVEKAFQAWATHITMRTLKNFHADRMPLYLNHANAARSPS